MSHAYGAVKFKDGYILYFEYNGTSDVVLPILRDTIKEVSDNWRSSGAFDRKCTCGNQVEDVEVACFYADRCWTGKACRKCKVILDPISMDYTISLQFDKDHWMYQEAYKDNY